jgi:hypothetical protein
MVDLVSFEQKPLIDFRLLRMPGTTLGVFGDMRQLGKGISDAILGPEASVELACRKIR